MSLDNPEGQFGVLGGRVMHVTPTSVDLGPRLPFRVVRENNIDIRAFKLPSRGTPALLPRDLRLCDATFRSLHKVKGNPMQFTHIHPRD